QAEDGIRDLIVTGVQTCALPIYSEATNIAGGLVACTGNTGCKYAATDTKGHAIALAEFLNKRVRLDQPINIHFTGCPNSCAQHRSEERRVGKESGARRASEQ